MLFQVGEIAQKIGLTIRTLHHYEEIGLLVPTARTDAGYRLYNVQCLERLTQIQMLRQVGVKLKDIGEILDGQSGDMAQMLQERICSLSEQIKQAEKLRYRLEQLQLQMRTGNVLTQADWFSILEMMSMYDKYFTPKELEQMPLYTDQTLKNQAWQQRVATVKSLMQEGVAVDSEQVRQISAEWMAALERDTGGNPEFFARLNKIHLSDNEFAASSGITEEMIDYVAKGFSEHQLAIFKPYLTASQFAFVKEHYFESGKVWPELIAGLYTAKHAGISPESPEVQALAQTWLTMFNQFTGGDPELQEKIRQIYRENPVISQGTWMTPEIGQYLFEALTRSFTQA
ncbi:MerR family transcriptional regulator [Providencia vermicola]|uniref:MerR family transcriptional regulator n=1 Tax=Providencia stuartii TaxID=588 RepID=A0ABD5L6T1_PROST|nr:MULTISPECIES: MerR family transcriptional regulator [Providencia]ELR5044761.1 MerR family transcriptional regulator [Providencia rettgeri]MCR4181232.1 MerR family transcriptional regulator [Providencia vermicola]URE79434.1 MerR family transcriptional regulator [Providencia stuartii]